MDGLSAAASVIAVATLAQTIAVNGFKLAKTFAGAEKEIQKLIQEVAILYGVLQSLQLLLERLEEDSPNAAQTTTPSHISGCYITLSKIERTLEKCGSTSASDQSKFLARNWKKARWPLNVSETESLVHEVERHKNSLSQALHSDGISSILKTLENQDRLAKDIADLVAAKNVMRREKFLAGLEKNRRIMLNYFSEFDHQKTHMDAVNLCKDGTGIWFTKGMEFSTWLGRPRAQLWLYGIPGSGKTILMQLACQNEDAFKEAERFWNAKGARGSSQLPILDHHDQGSQLRKDASEQQLFELLLKMSTHFQSVILLVDALDECGASTNNVANLLSQIATSDSGSYKCIYSSRNEYDVRFYLGASASVSIVANSNDLRLYVDSELGSRIQKGLLTISQTSDLRQVIVKTLIEKADGMFQWVKCQLDHLCDLTNDKDRRNALETLPPGLDATYERILYRINQRPKPTRDLVINVLCWIIQGEETLSVSELTEILSIRDGDTTLDPEARPTEDDILKACGSLIRKDRYGILEPSHYSVVEYLRKAPDPPQVDVFAAFRMKDHDVKRRLARACLNYLLSPAFALGYQYTTSEYMNLLEQHPFLSHAAMYWDHYAVDHLGDETISQSSRRLFDPSKSQTFLLWSQIRCLKETDDGQFYSQNKFEDEDLHGLAVGLNQVTPLHVAAALALDGLVDWLLSQSQDAVGMSESMGTPLHCATQGLSSLDSITWPALSLKDPSRTQAGWRSPRRHTVIQSLIGAGAGQLSNRNRYLSPLFFIASHSDRLECAQPIVDAGEIFSPPVAEELVSNYDETHCEKFVSMLTSQNLLDSDKHEILRILAGVVNKDVLDSFCQRVGGLGVHVVATSADPALGRLLREAAKWGQVKLLQELLDQGYDVNGTDEWAWTALHYASRNGHLNTVQVLLERDADTTLRSNDGDQAIGLSLYSGHTAVTLKLLQHRQGAHINPLRSNKNGSSLLHTASEYGTAEVLEKLLNLLGDKNYPKVLSSGGLTLLHVAVRGCNIDNVKLLLPRIDGDDINALSSAGLSPLMFAAAFSHLYTGSKLAEGLNSLQEVVKILLDAGANSDNHPKTFSSLLMVALSSPQPEPTVSQAQVFLDIPQVEIDNRDIQGYNVLMVLIAALDGILNSTAVEDFAFVIGNHFKIFEYLLRRNNTLVNLVDNNGYSSFHYLCCSPALNQCCAVLQEWRVFEIFLEHGACVDFTPQRGLDTLESVLGIRSANVPLIRLILSKLGKDENLVEPSRTILHRIVSHEYKNGLEEVVESLSGNGDVIFVKDSDEKTPFVEALLSVQPLQIIRTLLSKVCDECLAKQIYRGSSLLMLALAKHQDKAIDRATVDLILSRSADIDQAHPLTGNNILHLACSLVQATWLPRLLIPKIGNIDGTNNNGWTALHTSLQEGNEIMSLELIHAGADVSSLIEISFTSEKGDLRHNNMDPILYLVSCGSLSFEYSVFQALIDAGANLNHRDSRGWGLVHWCSKAGLEEALAKVVPLIRNHNTLCLGGDIYFGGTKISQLHIVAREGNLSALQILLDTGSFPTVNVKDSNGLTPLHYACIESEQDICNLLIRKGAAVNEIDNLFESTCLHFAARNGSLAVVRLLLQHGANLDHINKISRSPQTEALRAGYDDIAALLTRPITSESDDSVILEVARLENSDVFSDSRPSTALGTIYEIEQMEEVELAMETASFALDTVDSTTLHTLICHGTNSLWDRIIDNNHIDMLACFHDEEYHPEPPGSRCTLLNTAITHGNSYLSKLLVRNGADIHVMGCPNDLEALPLVRAIGVSDYELFRLILGRYTSPLSKQSYEAIATAIYCLIPCDSRSELECMRALCIHGSDGEDAKQKQSRFKAPSSPRRNDLEGNMYATALHAAASRCDNDAIKILLDSGADPKAVDESGQTALQVYSDNSLSGENLDLEDLNTLQILLNLEEEEDKKARRLSCRVNERIIRTIVDWPTEAGQLALSLYSEYQCVWRMMHTDAMSTALHLAASEGNSEVLRALIDGGDHVHAQNILHETPILSAAKSGAHEAVETLMELGASIEDKNDNGWNILQVCLELNSDLPAVTTILGLSSDPIGLMNYISNDGKSALHIALYQEGVCNQRSLRGIGFLIENGCSVDLRSEFEGCAIHVSAFLGQLEICKHLLTAMAANTLVGNLDFPASRHGTCLYAAASQGWTDIMELLLTYKVDIDNAESMEGTALNIATKVGQVRAVRWLLSRGASLRVTDSKGKVWNALETAKMCPQILHILIEHARKTEEGTKLTQEAGMETIPPLILISRPAIMPVISREGEVTASSRTSPSKSQQS